MSILTFFKSLTSTSPRRRPIHRRPSTLRLCVEALEDRCLLSFSPAVNYYFSGSLSGLAAVDFNGDGRLDLATNNGITIAVMRGNGDGTFQTALHSPSGGYGLLLADLNGDAKVDLVTLNDNNLDLQVMLGNGDGTFQLRQVIVLPSQLPPDAPDAYYPVQVPTWVAVTDLNADGKPDLVAGGYDLEVFPNWEARRTDYVNVLLGNGDGTFGPSTVYIGPPILFNGSPSVNVNDVNADGEPDRVDLVYDLKYYAELAYDTDRYAAVQLGNGDGFAPPVISDLGTVRAHSSPGSRLLADFDGDGFPELVVTEFRIPESGNAYSVVAVAHNDGNWTPPPPPPPPPPPSITLSDVTVTEGNTGTQAASFTVTLSAASSQPVTVAYTTANGSATADSDYQATSGTLTIPAGQTTGTITVMVNGDRLGEANETFFVNLSSPTNATIADGQGVGTITDDEPRISISDVTRKEGNGKKKALFVFTVTLSAAYEQAVTMSFRTGDGTAQTSDGDYVARTGTLTFAPGETTKTITIEVKGDTKKEANETFSLELFGLSSNGLFTRNRGLGTILNDD